MAQGAVFPTALYATQELSKSEPDTKAAVARKADEDSSNEKKPSYPTGP